MVKENKGTLRPEYHREDYGLKKAKRKAEVRVYIGFS
jgi:hypothetical protein